MEVLEISFKGTVLDIFGQLMLRRLLCYQITVNFSVMHVFYLNKEGLPLVCIKDCSFK